MRAKENPIDAIDMARVRLAGMLGVVNDVIGDDNEGQVEINRKYLSAFTYGATLLLDEIEEALKEITDASLARQGLQRNNEARPHSDDDAPSRAGLAVAS